jgi:SAM-dependent methyltransferase
MDTWEYLKTQLSPKDYEIVQGLGLNLDGKILAEMWPDFVNFEKRWKKEIPFLKKQLKKFENPKVFDSALGAGVTSIGLKLNGISNVTSNEIDKDYRKVALEQAKKYGVSLTITQYDWRELPDELAGTFDAVLCLGNSLSCLFKREDHLKAIRNFRKILKPGGELIIDERNYDRILRGDYNFKGNVNYCGLDKVECLPIYTSDSMVVFNTHTSKLEKELILLRTRLRELSFQNC